MNEIIVNTDALGKASFTEFEKESFRKMIAQFKNATILIRISKFSDTRTTKQNRYYWYLLNIIAHRLKELGNGEFDAIRAHEYLKENFLQKREVSFQTAKGEVLSVNTTKSSAGLTKKEFSDYIENIKVFLYGIS